MTNLPKQSLFANVIGLTGSSGSGKSSVSNIMADLGAFVISADKLAKESLNKDTPTYLKTIETFGDKILSKDGTINRKTLHSIVFDNPEKLRLLEGIIHPVVRKKVEVLINAHSNNDNPIIYDVPLLFEKNMDSEGFHKIILVSAPRDELIKRICLRDGINLQEAEQRLKNQLPDQEKRKRADIIIENDGTLEELRDKIEMLYPSLISSVKREN